MKAKRHLLIALGALFSISALSGCAGRVGTKIGILQLLTHPALDLISSGFKTELADNGYVDGTNISYLVQNPEGNSTYNYQMASNLAETEDMILAIATNSAIAAKTCVKNLKKETPVLFAAVTNPISAGLVSSITAPGENVTGTSDQGDIRKSLGLLDYFPDITSIGLLYNSSEPNSVIQISNTDKDNPKNDGAIQVCQEMGITAIDGAITSESMISTSIASMVAKGAKAIYVPTDNMVAAAMSAVKTAAIENHLLVICSDESCVETGGILSYGINYYELGKLTGKMAISILKGEKTAGEIDVGFQEDLSLTVNKKIATSCGITIPQELLDIADKVIE